MKIIICEAGATKADWRVVQDGRLTDRLLTPGINVSAMNAEAVRSAIQGAAASLPGGPYAEVHFYTAGVITPDIRQQLEGLLAEGFGPERTEIQTDLIASARAACGHAPGIAAILGTGSNSCQWDGERIVGHINSGGYIIGDEGSASVLGKLFISDYIKGLVPAEIAADYAARFPSEYADIVTMVYHNPGSPSGWLGGLAPFIVSHYDHPYAKALVDGNFLAFVRRCLKQYDTDRYPVGIVGGFGNAMQDIVRPIFEAEGIRIRAFIPAPIEELVKYHGGIIQE
ncbi:MAG: hypothetical protein IKZ91_03330 [Bacteroidales bacterium]|nr:hypothetical protein [Bacteroidales bacterium]